MFDNPNTNGLLARLADMGEAQRRSVVGLHPDRANENQGAESTLSFLMALLEMRSLQESETVEIPS